MFINYISNLLCHITPLVYSDIKPRINTPRKVSYVREAVNKIKSSSDYNWGDSMRCNCGMLAQVVTGLDANALRDKGYTVGVWYLSSPNNPLVAILIDANFTFEEISELEKCNSYFTNWRKEDTIKYMMDWANRMESEMDVVGNEAKSILENVAKESELTTY